MWQAVLQADRYLFEKINSDWTNPFLDAVFPWWRNQNTWLPLYLFLLLFVFMNFGWRIWPWVVTVALTVTLTDQFSSHLIKLWIQKPRPCQDPLMIDHVRLLIGCPGNPGFTSSHATNHFGAACLFYFTLKPVLKKWSNWWFFWAATSELCANLCWHSLPVRRSGRHCCRCAHRQWHGGFVQPLCWLATAAAKAFWFE